MVNLLWLFFGITVSNLYKKKLESFDRYSRFIIIDMNLAKTDGLKLVNQTRCCVKIWFSLFLAKLPFNLVQNRNKSCSFAATLVPVPKETWPPKYVMFGHNNLCKKNVGLRLDANDAQSCYAAHFVTTISTRWLKWKWFSFRLTCVSI